MIQRSSAVLCPQPMDELPRRCSPRCSSSPRVGPGIFTRLGQILTFSVIILGSEVHLQCDVIQCYGRCVEIDDCNDVALAGFGKGTNGPRKFGPNEEGSSLAGTTVFVLDPAEARCKFSRWKSGLFMIFILLYLGSDLGQLRGWHTAQLAAVANHHPGRTLPDHVADEHLPLHGHELQLCQYRGNKSDVYRYTEINQSLIRVHNMVEYRNLFFSAYTIKFPRYSVVLNHSKTLTDHREGAIDYRGVRSVSQLAWQSVRITLLAPWKGCPQGLHQRWLHDTLK